MRGLKQSCFYFEACYSLLLMIICQMCFTSPPQTFNLTLTHLVKLRGKISLSE